MNTIYASNKEDFEELSLFQNPDGTVKDLTGTFTSNIKIAKFYNTSPILTITGTVQSPATDGKVKYTATALQMAALSHGTFVYTKYLYDATGKVVVSTTGFFVIIPSV